MSSPKDFHIDAVYPEPLSRLRRGQGSTINEFSTNSSTHKRAVKKQLHRGGTGRFRTQPVTFYEIKEVDEDNIPEPEATGSAGTIFKSESDLKAKFEVFYRSINATSDSSSPNVKSSLPTSKLASISNSQQPTDAGPLQPPPDSISDDDITTPTSSVPLEIAFNPKSRPSI